MAGPLNFPAPGALESMVLGLAQALWDRLAASAGPWAFLLCSGLALSNPHPSLAWLRVEPPGGVTALLSLQGPLLRWLKVNFSEAFIAWVHIKALRVFVESVLR